jgi:hypothetical protein
LVLPRMEKREVAQHILDEVIRLRSLARERSTV